MNEHPILSVTRNGRAIASIGIGATIANELPIVLVNEMQQYGVDIQTPEIDVEYGLWIGDLPASQSTSSDNQSSSLVAVLFSGLQKAVWRDAYYFEGCRGRVNVIVRSREVGSERWEDRAVIPCNVNSGKISEEKYRSMLEQLSGLTFGLVFDLISKSYQAAGLGAKCTRQSIRSSSTELRIIEELWPTVAQCLAEIFQSPAFKLENHRALVNCWGSERFDTRSLATFAEFAYSPKDSAVTVPFRASVQRVTESMDTYEHRVIVGFIDLLSSRIEECILNLERHINALYADKSWRDIEVSSGISLYRLEDIPRIEQLKLRLYKAREIASQLKLVRRYPQFQSVRPQRWTASSMIFQNVSAYRRIEQSLVRYRRSSLVVVDDGTPEKVKATSRLYEQWCYLQIVAAIRHAGLRCISQSGVLHSVQKYRFNLDIDRGAQVTFLGAQGRTLVVRFEPWIMPRTEASHNRDSLYRGTRSAAAWSPDITLEFMSAPDTANESANVESVVVVDAKYATAIREHHWTGTDKYLEIRAVRSGKQVVRQHWLACPGDENLVAQGIVMRDPAISWTSAGPTCDQLETVQGILALSPVLVAASDDQPQGWVQPTPTAINFVSGILKFMNFCVPQTSPKN